MADIPQIGKISAIGSLAAHDEEPRRGPRDEDQPRPEPRTPEQIRDVAQVMGIPATELSEGVYEALKLVVAEMDKLRWELEIARKHEEYLYQLADTHPLMPILNRRAFHRELIKAAAHVKRTETPSSLLIIDVEEGRRAKLDDGFRARDAVMLKAAEIVRADVQPIDVLGGLGGDSLGVILNVMGEEAARQKGLRLAQLLGDDPAIRGGRGAPTRLAWGVCAIEPGEDAEEVLEKADGDLRAGGWRRDRPPPDPSGPQASGDDVG